MESGNRQKDGGEGRIPPTCSMWPSQEGSVCPGSQLPELTPQ